MYSAHSRATHCTWLVEIDLQLQEIHVQGSHSSEAGSMTPHLLMHAARKWTCAIHRHLYKQPHAASQAQHRTCKLMWYTQLKEPSHVRIDTLYRNQLPTAAAHSHTIQTRMVDMAAGALPDAVVYATVAAIVTPMTYMQSHPWLPWSQPSTRVSACIAHSGQVTNTLWHRCWCS